jgi:hypothetical protein
MADIEVKDPDAFKTPDFPSRESTSAEDAPDSSLYIDPAKEKKLLAKLDIAFTPIIMLLYLSCFLDRSNIGRINHATAKDHHC